MPQGIRLFALMLASSFSVSTILEEHLSRHCLLQVCVSAYVFVECMRLCVHVHVFAHVLLGYHAMPNV